LYCRPLCQTPPSAWEMSDKSIIIVASCRFSSAVEILSVSEMNLMNCGVPIVKHIIFVEINGDDFVTVWTVIYRSNFNRYVFNLYGNNIIVTYIKLYNILYILLWLLKHNRSFVVFMSAEISFASACVSIWAEPSRWSISWYNEYLCNNFEVLNDIIRAMWIFFYEVVIIVYFC